jgi:hypothetical protein
MHREFVGFQVLYHLQLQGQRSKSRKKQAKADGKLNSSLAYSSTLQTEAADMFLWYVGELPPDYMMLRHTAPYSS